MNDLADVCVTRISRWYDTPAWPPGNGPDFVNGAAVIRSDLGPGDVLQSLHETEAALGRRRIERWEPRICDVDLLGADDLVLPDAPTVRRWMEMPADVARTEIPDQLILPHPRMHERAFVLVPLQDVAADWVHPVTGRSVSEMVADLPAGARGEVIGRP